MRAFKTPAVRLAIAAALLLSIVSCSGDDPTAPVQITEPGPSLPPTIEHEGTFPPDQRYSAVSLLDAQNMAIAGSKGFVATRNSVAWTLLADVIHQEDLVAVAGTGPDDIVVVDRTSVPLHYDGTDWTPEDAGTVERLRALCSDPDGFTWAVGDHGTITRRDPLSGRWQVLSDLSVTSTTLHCACAAPTGEVYFGGSTGTIVEWSSTFGLRAQQIPGVTRNVIGVWASGPNDIWAITSLPGGQVIRFNGTVWSVEQIDTDVRLSGIVGFGKPATTVVAVGTDVFDGYAAKWENGAWSTLTTPHSGPINAVCATGLSELVTVSDGEVYAYQLTTDNWLDTITGTMRAYLADVWLDQSGEGFAVDVDGKIWRRTPAGDWEFSDRFDSYRLHSVWGSSLDNVFVSGTSGFIAHYGGGVWQEFASRPTFQTILVLRGNSTGEIYAGGYDRTLLHFDGDAWADISGDLAGVIDLMDINDIQVFDDGQVVVAASAALAHFDGSTWAEIPTTLEQVWAIWGTDPSNVLIGGMGGRVERWDGTTTSAIPVAPGLSGSRTIFSLDGVNANNVIAVGEFGTVLHFDGTQFTPVENNIGARITGLARGGGVAVAVGAGGLVLRLESDVNRVVGR